MLRLRRKQREQVLGIHTDESQGQIVFMDTPGIHRAREGGLNQFMVNQAVSALEAPHLIWYLVDPSSSLEFEMPVIDIIVKALNSQKAEERALVFVLLNKMDFAKEKQIPAERIDTLEKSISDCFREKGVPLIGLYKISALTGQGVETLVQDSWKAMPESPPYYPDPEQLSDRPTRFFVAEKIREQLLHCLGDELPYSCAVEITLFKRRS